jgi:hypothetical protein
VYEELSQSEFDAEVFVETTVVRLEKRLQPPSDIRLRNPLV